MIEQWILGVFLALPLVLVAAMFSDELWEEYRQSHPRNDAHHDRHHTRHGH